MDPNNLEGVEDPELKAVKEKFQDTQPTGCLLNLCKTLDQAKALLEFIDAIADKKLDRTVSLTAARGRGKSAALGVAIAAAIGFGYSNIFVTSPSPENLRTLFDFVFKAFDAMQYEEHTDYDLVQSTNPEFNQAVVRVNVHEEKNGGRRQTIQYLHPTDAHKLGQAELVVIDEAAAIPLPLVKGLFGPYLIFMASTINGYEGTGRSLSLKLLENLRQQQNPIVKAMSGKEVGKPLMARMLREITLDESIRYKPGDAVEDWLNRLLCLDATVVQPLSSGCPAKDDCDLYYINRDTLFCYHKASEAFLQRIMSLFVASHYKNSPNDLQMLSDAPGHHIFCLLGPVNPKSNSLPEVLCVIQVCMEGLISRDSIMKGLSRGKRAAGDLIPWTMSQQFQDDNFPSLSGARIIRIATHPDYQRMGYGSKSLELLQKYYEMKVPNLMEEDTEFEKEIDAVLEEDVGLLEENIGPRKNLPPLLLKLSERRPERLDYLGVSYGLTQELLRFWKRCGFTPTYLRQTANDLTGEHSTIMLKMLNHGEDEHVVEETSSAWLPLFWSDFRRRFVSLLGYDFRKFSPSVALGVLSNRISKKGQVDIGHQKMTEEGLSLLITPYDLKRLEQYGNNMADYHLIMDLMPNLAKLYFLYKVEGMGRCHLSALQQAILVGMGLQCKAADSLAQELGNLT
jgi:N-acetyltransferase 10